MISFNRGYQVGSTVRVEQSQVITRYFNTYTLKDSQVNTVSPFGSVETYGDVNDPSIGSRWKSLSEPDDANNIIYEGSVKQIEYKDPNVTSLSEGGYYSSIIN